MSSVSSDVKYFMSLRSSIYSVLQVVSIGVSNFNKLFCYAREYRQTNITAVSFY